MAENPWTTLRAAPWLTLVYDCLPDGVAGEWHGDVIVLDHRLDRVTRRCALMHELVHVERGVGWPDATAATMEREEAIVRREATTRLVPPAELAAFAERRGAIDAQVVAEQFDVTPQVATEAMGALLLERGVSWPS